MIMSEVRKNPDGTTSIIGGFSSKKDGMLAVGSVFRKPTKEELEAKHKEESK